MSSEPANAADRVRAVARLEAAHANPTLVNITLAARGLESLRSVLGRVPLRVGCLSSFTFEPLLPALELQGLRAGFALTTYVAPFGQFEQELLNPDSGLNNFKPDVVILAVRLPEVCPPLYEAFNDLSPEQAVALVEDWTQRLGNALSAFRRRSRAHLLIQNYEMPAHWALGPADPAAGASQAGMIASANTALRELALSLGNTWILDYDGLVARHGRLHWEDPRTAFWARIPVAAGHYWALTGFYVRHLRPLYGLTKKAIVLDADNTLWGGVVGDAGLNGIALGHDYPGNAFVAFQKKLLDLYHRGILLCLASKNQPGTVEEVLEKHPHMVLRREHFAACRINWNHKPDNLRAMAAELNLGLDSFVFLDDSAVECELMRTSLPEVMTVQMPADPAHYLATLEALDCFDQWAISEEDRQRGQLYKAEADRRVLQSVTTDLPSFYRQLKMKLTLSINQPAHIGRAAQMTNRTNQFNMHTVRCSEDDIRRFMGSPEYQVITLALRDRFGDNGIVGLAVVRREAQEWTLYLFLMSCRVLGRTVEQTFVAWIAEQARQAGAQRLIGLLKPTSKNQPFAGFYESCGFAAAGTSGDTQLWAWDLATASAGFPDWFEIEMS